MSARNRKLAIVQAALPLFARKGFAETTTKELAKAAGVSEPLLYKHFPSKEALYLEIQNFSSKGLDPAAQKLGELEPSASTLVHLVYYLLRALILGRPAGSINWDTRHRLMLKSFLEDGSYARLLYQNRFECFCSRIAGCLDAAIASGAVVKSPVSNSNRARFAYHVGAGIASVRLPQKPAIDYRVEPEDLLNQAVWFALRGMGMTDEAIRSYYNPKALALFFRGSI